MTDLLANSAMKTWWIWTEEERKNFLEEANLSVRYAPRNNWNDIPDDIQNAVIKHLKSKGQQHA